MKRSAFLLLALTALCIAHAESSHAANPDAAACHHGLDTDKGKVAGISDPAKKAEAADHLKVAYSDLKESKYTDCLGELKAADALMQ